MLRIPSEENIPENFTGIVMYPSGTKIWYKERKIHRLDGPAIETPDGEKEWWKEGKQHRLDGPAVEYTDGEKRWLKEGMFHRIDGPAIQWKNGNGEWWVDGKRYYRSLDIRDWLFLETTKGKYDLYWYKFFTEEGIAELPILPGLNYEFCIR